MAMMTLLQAVSEVQLEQLRREPDSIGQVEASGSYFTYFAPSVNYFLAGKAYPSGHELAPVVQGAESIRCTAVEVGFLGIVAPALAGTLARRLADVDLAEVKSRIEGADLASLIDEEELEDLELLAHDEVPDQILTEITRLAAFYAKVAEARHGVVVS